MIKSHVNSMFQMAVHGMAGVAWRVVVAGVTWTLLIVMLHRTVNGEKMNSVQKKAAGIMTVIRQDV